MADVYILYEAASGKRIGQPVTEHDGFPTMAVLVFGPLPMPDFTLVDWDPAQRLLVPKVPTGRTLLSQIEFRFRWTATERQTLHKLRIDPATALSTRAALEDMETLTSASINGIDLAYPPVAGLLDGALAILVLAGVLPAAGVASRKAELLTPMPVGS